MKISALSKKAYKRQTQSDSYCAQIVIQAGDGLVFTDTYGSNVPVSTIDKIIEEKGYFTYDDFESNKI